MPVYSYHCKDCGEVIEVLHGVARPATACGLQCRRHTPGPFGKGTLERVLEAPQIAVGGRAPGGEGTPVSPDAVRQEALQRMGGQITERDLDAARDRGLTVYRKAGEGVWAQDGGDPALPGTLRRGR